MIICISGLSGSGKNTAGRLVAKKLGLKEVQFSFKKIASKKKISLMELQKIATGDESYDKKLDAEIVKKAEKGNCVVTTWLGPWMVKNADLRVWLDVSESERARRVANRDKMSHDDALKHIRERDRNNWERYKKYYDIDIHDHSIFDLVIKSDSLSPEQVAEEIVEAAKKIER
jgi:cytidylate kinase